MVSTWEDNLTTQGPRSKFSSGGAKEECVKENFGGGPGVGGMLVDFYSISLAREIPNTTWIEMRDSVCHNAFLES